MLSTLLSRKGLVIEAHIGLPGSGKTLHATARLLAARRLGRRALANFHCQSFKWKFALWAEMVEATNCFCVIDEAHQWFSARRWTQTEQDDLAVFQQHRKEGMDIVWIAQAFERVDVAVREVTAFIWRHKRLGRFVLASKVTPDDVKKVIGRRVVPIRKSLYSDYFTEETIGRRDGTGYKFGAGAAYKRSAGAGPALDEHFQLRANYYRLEFPSHVKYMRADGPGISEAVAVALVEWRATGFQGGPEDICKALYRGVDGRYHELDVEGDLKPNENQRDLFEQALELFDQLREALKDRGKMPGPTKGIFPKPFPKFGSAGS